MIRAPEKNSNSTSPEAKCIRSPDRTRSKNSLGADSSPQVQSPDFLTMRATYLATGAIGGATDTGAELGVAVETVATDVLFDTRFSHTSVTTSATPAIVDKKAIDLAAEILRNRGRAATAKEARSCRNP